MTFNETELPRRRRHRDGEGQLNHQQILAFLMRNVALFVGIIALVLPIIHVAAQSCRNYDDRFGKIVNGHLNVTLPEDSTTIDNPDGLYTTGPFYYCTQLKTMTLPANLESIGNYAFFFSGLIRLEVPKSVSSIGREAFRGCPSLTNVTFGSPSALTTVGVGAFVAKGLLSGGSVAIDENKASLLRVAGTMMYNVSVNGVAFAPYGPMDGDGNVMILNTVASIRNQAFIHCKSLTSVTFEENSALATIGHHANQDQTLLLRQVLFLLLPPSLNQR